MSNSFAVVDLFAGPGGLAEGFSAVRGVASEIPNPLEWAKQQACWNRVQNLQIEWPDDWQDVLITGEDQKETKRSAVNDQRMLNGIEAQTAVVGAGKDFWIGVKAWGGCQTPPYRH